jgi:hypothetical protein
MYLVKKLALFHLLSKTLTIRKITHLFWQLLCLILTYTPYTRKECKLQVEKCLEKYLDLKERN